MHTERVGAASQQLCAQLDKLDIAQKNQAAVSPALPAVQMDSPGIALLRHNSNAARAAYVAEPGLKPSIVASGRAC